MDHVFHGATPLTASVDFPARGGANVGDVDVSSSATIGVCLYACVAYVRRMCFVSISVVCLFCLGGSCCARVVV